ncbi:MAG: alkaline phosphatase [Bacteroidota bacterium]|jgi:alkaline phosphatase|nr:alkaline phosphatase [Bacteroidota bacterium]
MRQKTLPFALAALCLLLSGPRAMAQDGGERGTPKNIIVLIGDGLGVGQLTTMKALLGEISLDAFPVGGLVATQSRNNFVTESGAGGTALSTGERVRNRLISQREDGTPLRTLLEAASAAGKATGTVSTSAVTHATPASFLTHAGDRGREMEIAAGIARSGADAIIGGGRRFFLPSGAGGAREDGRNLVEEMQAAGYTVATEPAEEFPDAEKLLWLLDEDALPPAGKRAYDLRHLVLAALSLLARHDAGFVLMIEGSQIDWACHDNNFAQLKEELRDFDGAVATALDFAAGDGETLIVVTADHETAGLALTGTAPDGSDMVGHWISDDHTANMVPLLAVGPAAHRFGGLKRNDEIGRLLHELLR